MPRDRRTRHGLNALKARVKVRGLGAIDVRTVAGRALVAGRRALVEDLGGPDAVSTAQLALVELACRTRLYIDSLDAWLMDQPSLVLSRRRAVLPVQRERQALVDSLARVLGQLGLERKAKTVPDGVPGGPHRTPQPSPGHCVRTPREGLSAAGADGHTLS